MEEKLIFSEKIDDLSTLLEEASRASKQNITRFIEPGQGTLRRAQSKRHHIIFGRRGSGKSSLLFKTADLLSSKGHPIAFIDLEPFKGHQYPDLIISVLLAAFSKYKIWLKINGEDIIEKRIWYLLWLKKKKGTSNTNKDLISRIDDSIRLLTEQLYLTDEANLIQKISDLTSNENLSNIKGNVSAGLKSMGSSSIETAIASSVSSSISKEIQEEYKRSKTEFLLKQIINFQQTFDDFFDLYNKDCFIFLDDLYHVMRRDQANLIDYFHRIAKGNHVWLKIGTIRNRTNWYINNPQPVGLKIGDDADEINLDLTLEKFAISKQFLKSILEIYIVETNAPKIDDFIAEGGMDRLVISSGGVTRDFLGLFRKSIDETRERLRKNPGHVRGDKIGAEDVNLASGAYGELKKEEFRIDTHEDKTELEITFNKILKFCLENTKKNIFLIDQDSTGSFNNYLLELVDLRLIHQIKSRITVSSQPGKLFKALLLDVSQYTGERARRDVEMIEFWKDTNKEVLRRASLIFSDESAPPENEKSKMKNLKKSSEKKEIHDDDYIQTDLDFK